MQRKNNGSEDKQKKYDEKISQPTTISVHTQKMANTNLKKKKMLVIVCLIYFHTDPGN